MSIGEQISIYDLEHPENEQDPRVERTNEQIQRVQDRFEESGWLSPIIFTTDDLLIVDGNTRVEALKNFRNIEHLQVLAKYQGYAFALPDTELTINPEEASAELNIYRENLTEPDRAKFLKYLVESRILDDDRDSRVASDATDELSTTELLSNLENDARDDREYTWEHGDDTKTKLIEFLDALDFESPERARNVLTSYKEAPEKVRELWVVDELYSGHVEELTRIHEQIQEGATVSDSFTAGDGHTFDDLIEYSRKEYQTEDEYYRRTDLRDIHDELDAQLEATQSQKEKQSESTTEDESEAEATVEPPETKADFLNELDEEHRQMIDEMTIDGDHPFLEFLDHDNIVDFCYDNIKHGAERFQENPEELIEELKYEFDKMAERAVNLDEFPFNSTPFDATYTGSITQLKERYEESVPHLAPPLLLDEQGTPIAVEEGVTRDEDYTFGIFFHDNKLMDMEIPDEHLHLLFFSPPYFDQAGVVSAKDFVGIISPTGHQVK